MISTRQFQTVTHQSSHAICSCTQVTVLFALMSIGECDFTAFVILNQFHFLISWYDSRLFYVLHLSEKLRACHYNAGLHKKVRGSVRKKLWDTCSVKTTKSEQICLNQDRNDRRLRINLMSSTSDQYLSLFAENHKFSTERKKNTAWWWETIKNVTLAVAIRKQRCFHPTGFSVGRSRQCLRRCRRPTWREGWGMGSGRREASSPASSRVAASSQALASATWLWTN